MGVFAAYLVAALQASPGPREIERLIGDLGAESYEVRERAHRGLVAVGEPVLEALAKATQDNDPEVRSRAREIDRFVRDRLHSHVWRSPLLARLQKLRDRWREGAVKDAEEATRELFKPDRLAYVHHVARKEVADRFDRDHLSPALAKALDEEGGLVFLDEPKGDADPLPSPIPVLDRRRLFLFTLRDPKGGSSYLIVRLDPDYASGTFRSGLLARFASGQVWGIDLEEIDWARRHVTLILMSDLELEPVKDGGVRLKNLRAGSILLNRGYCEGDVVREINGKAVGSKEGLEKALKDPELGKTPALRISVERAGRTHVLEYRPLPR